MTDFDYIPIETTEGHRPPSPAADRLLIGLAAVALCGGLLIAAGNFLGADDEVSLASASPDASAAPSRTPRPTPSPRPRLELDLQPAVLPSVSPQPSVFSGWIRASTDLVVRNSRGVDAPELGMLVEGAVAQADEWAAEPSGEMGWLWVNAPSPQGWVATMDGETPLAERFGYPSSVYGGSVWTVVAGDDGFLAIGTRGGRADQASPPIPMVSSDGARWRAGSAPPEWISGWSTSAAWGPAGWVSTTMAEGTGGTQVIWVSQSEDGREWHSLGAFQGLPPDTWMGQLVGSDRGYMMSTSGRQSSFWFSADGVTWRESEESGLSRDASIRVVATAVGFYAWEEGGWGPAPIEPVEGVFSIDGRTWSLVAGGPGGANRQIVSVGDRLLGMDPDPVSGAPRLWTGIPARGSFAWRLTTTDLDVAFRHTAPTTLISDGERAFAFGWDRVTEVPLVWELQPTGWQPSALPAAFGGFPRIGAAGPAGFVIVGSRPTLRGTNPIFWHETDGGAWAPERSPFMEVAPDPAPDECGPPPRDALEFAALDRVLASVCFGNEPITFRAWAAVCEGCYGSGGGSYETDWLMGLTNEQLYLSPMEDTNGGWWSPSPVHPSLDYDPSWHGQWLEVTGHFNDPAAAECRWMPPPEELWYYEGRRVAIEQCRQQFAITEVSLVSGP